MDDIQKLRRAVGPELLMLAGTAVAVRNTAGEYLLQKWRDGRWGVPGGFIEPGESAEEAGCREVLEETGILTADYQLAGVFSGREYPVRLPNGDEFCPVTIAYTALEAGGVLRADGTETIEAGFFPAHRLPDGLSPLIRNLILRHASGEN
ncbi:NUDIX hydrolase [Gorillibacterium sp. sgz500922]|uniref:NUDIX hydrolase n=1 Tax=Gorillibacterium sp. sgz500922 TaxID=3446694 RepID=UPI003F66F329